ncbi:ATP-binding cassette domain-containing protein [Marinospirillum sp. MEB164]|uniref:ATP-binding cassette domain-containing protein n=1 Tax=Marinospirillum alkalitolerans TaxID=3123374 RepID=A0ABW8PV82_9GAMM
MDTTPPKSELSAVVLEAQGLGYRLTQEAGELIILDDIHLSVYQGESVAILGPSGSGKSTLLALLAGLDVPTQGQLTWRQQPFSQLDEDARALIRAQEVGFIFQSFQLLPELTALENVALPLELRGEKQALHLARQQLEQVGLAARAQHRPHQMSGGEQQRVAIARAFAAQPQVLFADEPTGNLDGDNGAKVADLLFALNDQTHQPLTLILVTHDEALAQRCQRIVRLKSGRIAAIEAGGAA